MARPLRIEYPGSFHHLINRGNSRQNIFLADEDMELFLGVLEEASKLYGIELYAFCLMYNHYHLLIHNPLANLQKAMRYVGSVYTMRFNRRHKKDGHLFRGRYKSILVEEEDYLRNLIRYIHLNPVKAGLVLDPADWQYSSHAYLVKRELSGYKPFQAQKMLQYFSGDIPVYLDHLQAGVDEITERFYSQKRLKPFFASPEAAERIRMKLREVPRGIEQREEYLTRRDPNDVLDDVALVFSATRPEINEAKRGARNYALLTAMSLLKHRSGFTHGQIAAFLNQASPETVTKSLVRFQEVLGKNTDMAEIHEALSATTSHKS